MTQNDRRNRPRRPARREPFRDSKPRILVVTEGAATEVDYLKGFINAVKNPLVQIQIAPEHGRAPVSLVEIANEYRRDANRQAARERDENLRFESVWCVFDVDDHPRIPEAKETARQAGIMLAISNPNVELWLLLHFRASPGMQHREEIAKLLKAYDSEYEKHVQFDMYFPKYQEALQRARQLDNAAQQDHEEGRNPSTGVYLLTETIRTSGKY